MARKITMEQLCFVLPAGLTRIFLHSVHRYICSHSLFALFKVHSWVSHSYVIFIQNRIEFYPHAYSIFWGTLFKCCWKCRYIFNCFCCLLWVVYKVMEEAASVLAGAMLLSCCIHRVALKQHFGYQFIQSFLFLIQDFPALSFYFKDCYNHCALEGLSSSEKKNIPNSFRTWEGCFCWQLSLTLTPAIACLIHSAGRRKEKGAVGNKSPKHSGFQAGKQYLKCSLQGHSQGAWSCDGSTPGGRGSCSEGFWRSSTFWWSEHLAPPGPCKDLSQ